MLFIAVVMCFNLMSREDLVWKVKCLFYLMQNDKWLIVRIFGEHDIFAVNAKTTKVYLSVFVFYYFDVSFCPLFCVWTSAKRNERDPT
jgi:hypothetical protein